jgi:hypothetical protein
MPRVLVNCHGGRVANPLNPPQFRVPAGVSIHFYVNDGNLLSDTDGWRVLTARQNLTPPPPNIFTVVSGPGTMCFDYYGVPYTGLGVANGIQVERPGRRGVSLFEPILEGGAGQQWGLPMTNTVRIQRPVLPAIAGGPPYARPALTLSNIANWAAANGFTDVDWISCREHW